MLRCYGTRKLVFDCGGADFTDFVALVKVLLPCFVLNPKEVHTSALKAAVSSPLLSSVS